MKFKTTVVLYIVNIDKKRKFNKMRSKTLFKIKTFSIKMD